MKKRKIWLWITGIFLLITAGIIFYYLEYQKSDTAIVTPLSIPELTIITTPSSAILVPSPSDTTPSPTALPAEINLAVPFLTQAPLNNWSDPPHVETCEEASMVMIKYYLDGKKKITPQDGEGELQAMVKYETEHSMGVDVSLEQMKQIMEGFYGLNGGRIINDPTIAQIKGELADGHSILWPVAGKLLPNPYYRSAGIYHMLVVKGYKGDVFITNDNGTNHGENFIYKQSLLMDVLHDWNEQNILNGKKAILIY